MLYVVQIDIQTPAFLSYLTIYFACSLNAIDCVLQNKSGNFNCQTHVSECKISISETIKYDKVVGLMLKETTRNPILLLCYHHYESIIDDQNRVTCVHY